MTQYTKENKAAFIKDVLAMANSHHKGSKHIILGVKDVPGDERKLVGIEN
jgi:predicted HTH transcriptional regulator